MSGVRPRSAERLVAVPVAHDLDNLAGAERQRPREHLDAWLAWASRSKLEPFVRLARTIRQHRDGILTAIRLGLTNGRLEGLNSRIRLISHRSFGFHSAAPLIALVYLCCSGIRIALPR
ncbi:MAG: transposase [Solirubrobacteraceae bacterium]